MSFYVYLILQIVSISDFNGFVDNIFTLEAKALQCHSSADCVRTSQVETCLRVDSGERSFRVARMSHPFIAVDEQRKKNKRHTQKNEKQFVCVLNY